MNWLFFIEQFVRRQFLHSFGIDHLSIVRHPPPRRIDGQRGGRGHGRRILCLHKELLTERRNRCGGDPLGESFLIDLRYVVDPQTTFTRGNVGVFTAQLHLQNSRVPLVFISHRQLSAGFHEFLVVAGIRNFMKRTTKDRLRLDVFGHDHSFERVSRGHVDIAPHEIDKVRAEQKQLGHPGIVVVVL